MIQAQELRDQLAFALDAEGSEHYMDAPDYIPAINGSIKWLTAVVNSAMGQNKLSEEFFRDISYSGVFKPNVHSRISLSVFPNEVWTILAINPRPQFTGTPGPTPNPNESYYMSTLVHVSSDFDCKRLTVEEWSRNKRNPFEAGYDSENVCDDLKRYAYLAPVNYSGTNTGNTSQEIEIRPSVANSYATVFWAKKPSEIVNITDQIEFPASTFQLLFNKALNYLAFKQGDQTNLYSVSNNDIQQLLSLI